MAERLARVWRGLDGHCQTQVDSESVTASTGRNRLNTMKQCKLKMQLSWDWHCSKINKVFCIINLKFFWSVTSHCENEILMEVSRSCCMAILSTSLGPISSASIHNQVKARHGVKVSSELHPVLSAKPNQWAVCELLSGFESYSATASYRGAQPLANNVLPAIEWITFKFYSHNFRIWKAMSKALSQPFICLTSFDFWLKVSCIFVYFLIFS